MAVDIFRNPTMKLPKSDKQIVRVDMEQDDIQGQKASSSEPVQVGRSDYPARIEQGTSKDGQP